MRYVLPATQNVKLAVLASVLDLGRAGTWGARRSRAGSEIGLLILQETLARDARLLRCIPISGVAKTRSRQRHLSGGVPEKSDVDTSPSLVRRS